MPNDTHVNAMEGAFLDAYDRNADAVFRHCRLRVHHREQAQEITQETFMRTWRYMADGNEITNLRAFIFKVANNLIIDAARKKRELSLEAVLEDDDQEPGEDTTDRIAEGVDAKTAAAMIDGLDEIYREAVTMRYLEGLTPQEIAEMLDETANAVSVRIHRGVEKLRERLGYKNE